MSAVSADAQKFSIGDRVIVNWGAYAGWIGTVVDTVPSLSDAYCVKLDDRAIGGALGYAGKELRAA